MLNKIDEFRQKNWLFDAINYQDALIFEHKIKSSVKIAILDTGIDQTYDSKGLTIKRCSIFESDEGIDTIGHGTFSCFLAKSILEPFFNSSETSVEIISIKVSQNGFIRTGDLVRGLELALKSKVDIINIGMCNTYFDNELAKLTKEAYDKNIVIIAPSGNFIKEKTTYPGALPTVIACGSINEKKIAQHSNEKGFIDVFAPGESIYGYLPMDSRMYRDLKISNKDLACLDGTSFAAIIVSSLMVICKSIDKTFNGYKAIYYISILSKAIQSKLTGKKFPRLDYYEFLSLLVSKGINEEKLILKESLFHIKLDIKKLDTAKRLSAKLYDSFGEESKKSLDNISLKLFGLSNRGIEDQSPIFEKNNIRIKDGYFYIDLSPPVGAYMLYIEGEKIESSTTLFTIEPKIAKVNLVTKDGKQYFISDKVNILYSFNNDSISIQNGNPIEGCYKYEGVTEIDNKKVKKINFSTFSDGLFSEVRSIIVKEER